MFDGIENTVIMIQTENEIGMLPTARDYHPLANKKFQENVPIRIDAISKKEQENFGS